MEMGLEPVKTVLPLNRSAKNDKEPVHKTKSDPGAKQRPSKYGAKQTIVDGVKFPSKAEADYYCRLKLRMQAGQLAGFCRQPEFILQDGDGTVIRYKADFAVWFNDGTTEVIECKGCDTADWKLREKLFRAKFPNIKLIVERS